MASGFVDEAQLHVRAGDGGAGAVSFRREAHVPRGGPDGGDGGKGGDVWLVADRNVASLLGFKDHPFRRATNGVHGQGGGRHGANGSDTRVSVPEGAWACRRVRQGVLMLPSAPSLTTTMLGTVLPGGQLRSETPGWPASLGYTIR